MRALYLGSQLGYQGIATLLRGLAHAAKSADVRLSLVGPKHAVWQPHLAGLVDERKLAEKVELRPPVPREQLSKLVAAADVGMLPLEPVERNTLQGGRMAKLSDYIAGGRPVVASDLEVARELLPEGAAVFYPAGSAEALGERLVELSLRPELRIEMGRKARAHKHLIDGASARRALVELYDALLGKETEVPDAAPDDVILDPTAWTPTALSQRDTGTPTGVNVEDLAARAHAQKGKMDPWYVQLIYGYCPPES